MLSILIIMPNTRRPTRGTPEYVLYTNQLMKELYEKSVKEKEQEKIYHPVDFSEKDIAKHFGAKWDKDRKSWYFTSRDDWEWYLNYEG